MDHYSRFGGGAVPLAPFRKYTISSNYRLFFLLHFSVISFYISPNIVSNIFLFSITNLFSSDLLSVRISEPYNIKSYIRAVLTGFFCFS